MKISNINPVLTTLYTNKRGNLAKPSCSSPAFKKISDLNPSATDINSTLLNSDIILMLRGIIRFPDIDSYDSGKCFSTALYSMRQKQMYRMENTSCDYKGKEYVFKKNNKSAIIFITNKKPIIYKI